MKPSLFLTIFTLLVSFGIVPVSQAQNEATMQLITGDLQSIPVKNLTRISVTDPSIADISDAQADKVMVVGKKPGQTLIFLWDDSGKHNVSVSVVGEDLKILKARLEDVIEKSNIRGVSLEASVPEGKVVISGELSKKDKVSLDKIVDPYSDDVLNLTKEEVSEQLVQVDMQIIELNTTFEKNLGIDWGNAIPEGSGNANTPLQLNYAEAVPASNGKIEDFFKIGNFSRANGIVASFNAAIEEGKARILSKPRLVVVSGKEASFLVGGEIPIKSETQSNTGSTITENTTFKQYGVNLTVTPTVREGKIDIVMDVEIRDIDSSKPTGDDIAFLTRTAQTNLFLENEQTIVLAGLIKHNDGVDTKGIPILSKIPVVGMLFRNTKTPVANSDTEMVIILTPRILKDVKYADRQTVMPTPGERGLSSEIEAKYEHQLLHPVDADPDPTPLPVAPSVPMPKIDPPMLIAPAMGSMPYAMTVQDKISKGISYPYEALQNNWQGTVKLKLHILKDGTLEGSSVLESSGHGVFDEDALNTAKIAAPYPAFPAGLNDEDLIITVPIIYSRGTLLKTNNQAAIASLIQKS